MSLRWATLALAAAVPATAADDPKVLLRSARAQLDPCEALIKGGSWDGVRNIVKTSPLANVKSIAKAYADQSGEAGEDLLGPREDFTYAVQMLDMAVYNNVFVGEQNAPGKKGSGVTTDFATPLRYLQDCKAALDEMIAF